ncbi:MAG: AAA family ATPase [Bacilli bacterium]
MNTDYFKDIYKDFFGVETPKEENKKIEESSQNIMTTLFDKINKLYIKDESKELLKKIIEYMRKYNEGIETNYIPFNILIEVNNKETKEELINILETASVNFNYIKNNNKKEISLINLEKDINYDYGFITITNLKGINNIETSEQTKLFNNLEEFLEKEEKTTTLVIGTKEELTNFFLGRESIKNKYFNFNIIGTNPDIQDIYEYILNNINIEDNMKPNLLDYITKTYKNDNYVEYRNNLIKYISFNKELPKIEEKKTLEEIFKDLNELVGLEKVKKVLYDLVDVINLKEKAKNLTIKDMNLHMVFLGNPGTGKTTIARIISNILYNLGYIKENKLIEVSSKDLVGQYVGQTAPKTMDVINKSLNGVLFIDEAYSLAVKGENSYNAEAIATLIQAMENYRDKLVVIFAGYTKEMQDFLDSNSGIVSRIGYTLEFDDYTTEELIKIFNNFATKNGFIVNEEAIKYLEEVINENRNTKNFGNARFVRNIYEKTVIKHATNVKDKKQNKILKTITKEDISIENLNLN